MTNTEFQNKLNTIFEKYPFIAASKKKTVNELCYVLRMNDSTTDYCISIVYDSTRTICVPSVKECFITVKDLAMHVKEVEYDGEEFGVVCLMVYVED